MQAVQDRRPPLVGLSDELIRLSGRLRVLFADARRPEGLGDSEMTTLNAVVEADRPPTVPQIGRSLGVPRQIVQRAANSLVAPGLVETLPNSDHRCAALLGAAPKGIELKRGIDARADALAAATADNIDAGRVRQASALLNETRRELEARMRAGDRT